MVKIDHRNKRQTPMQVLKKTYNKAQFFLLTTAFTAAIGLYKDTEKNYLRNRKKIKINQKLIRKCLLSCYQLI